MYYPALLPCLLRAGNAIEPVWQAGEKSVGCRVAGFQNESDGSVGQAERFGKLKNGDILTDINGVPVRGMPFDKVRIFAPGTRTITGWNSIANLDHLTPEQVDCHARFPAI